MQHNNERYSVDVVSNKHIKMNERLLKKVFERYIANPWKYNNDSLCRIINEANIRCKHATRKGLMNPKKTPSLIIKNGIHSKSPPKKLLNESRRMIAAQQLQSNDSISPQNSPEKSIRDLLASFRGHSIHHNNADDTLLKFSESEIEEVANQSIVEPPPGFQLPRRIIPKINTPQDTPNSSFDRPMHISTPQRLNVGTSRIKSSTPYRLEVVPRNLESSFTVSMTPADQSSIRKITYNDNFTKRDLTSIIEILENLPNIDHSNNSISLSSRSLNVTPGSYELFKVFR